MDYKQKISLMNWHARYSKFNGTESRLLMLLISECNYLTNEFCMSYDKISKIIQSSKPAVIKAIEKLIQECSIIVKDKSTGTTPSTYKISDVEKLNFIYEKNVDNRLVRIWLKERDSKFFEVWDMEWKLNNLISECKDCKSGDWTGGICSSHQMDKNDLDANVEYRKYKVWLMDNPKPQNYIKTVKDIEVG